MAETVYLPEGVIHLILSYLCPEERARIGAVSKDWWNAWKTYPKLEFKDSDFESKSSGESQEERSNVVKLFEKYVEKTVDRYEQGNLHELSLSHDDDDSAPFFNDQIRAAAKKGARAIRIVANRNVCLFPESIPEAKSLRDLSLELCKFAKGKFSSNRIRSLHLGGVHIDDEMLANFISSCHRIEDLEIEGCEGLSTIKVENCCSTLKRCQLGYFRKNLTIEVDAPSLERLEMEGIDRLQNLELHSSEKLKVLELNDMPIHEAFFEYFSSKFPNLECLAVKKCHGYRRIHLTSNSLKELKVSSHEEKGSKGIEITINAPNLIKFDYGFITDFKDQSLRGVFSDQCKSCIRTLFNWSSEENGSWFKELNELVANLSPPSKVSLEFEFAYLINEKMTECIIPTCDANAVEIESLHLDVNFGSEKEASMFLKCLFLACRPKTIIQTNKFRNSCHFLYLVLLKHYKMQRIPKVIKGDTFSEIIHTLEWNANSTLGEDEEPKKAFNFGRKSSGKDRQIQLLK